MTKKILTDVNGKISFTRKTLNKYIPIIIICDIIFVFITLFLNRDLGSNSTMLLISLNGAIIGGGWCKLGIEHYNKYKDKL